MSFYLKPAAEVPNRNSPFDFTQTPFETKWIYLSGTTHSHDIDLVIANLSPRKFRGQSSRTKLTLNETLERIIHTGGEKVLGGGLVMKIGGLEIRPGCCCGLESWRDWEGVKRGGRGPWLGHHPSPWIDCSNDKAVIWSDDPNLSNDGRDPKSFEVEYTKVSAALTQASQNLSDFAYALKKRLFASEHEYADLFANRFAEWFSIDRKA